MAKVQAIRVENPNTDEHPADDYLFFLNRTRVLGILFVNRIEDKFCYGNYANLYGYKAGCVDADPSTDEMDVTASPKFSPEKYFVMFEKNALPSDMKYMGRIIEVFDGGKEYARLKAEVLSKVPEDLQALEKRLKEMD